MHMSAELSLCPHVRLREKLKMHDLRYKPDSYLAEWCLSDNHLQVGMTSQDAVTVFLWLCAVAAG